MPSRKPLPLTLTPLAEQDLEDILLYTGNTWGWDQLVAYREKIRRAFATLSENFEMGHGRADLPATHMAYLVGAHVIIYRAIPNKAHADRMPSSAYSTSR